MLKIWNGTEEMDKNQGAHQYLCDEISYPGTAKKLISSSDLSSVLVGRIKVTLKFCDLLENLWYLFFFLHIQPLYYTYDAWGVNL